MRLSEVEERVRRDVGVRLFTVLAWLPGRRVLHRAHSSHPEQYPVGGEKSVEVAADWLERCIVAREPYFGPDEASVREVFADHRLIAELGCGSVINAPVVGPSGALGVLNLLDAPGAYQRSQVPRVEELASLAVPVLSELVQRIDEPEEESTP
ncbi:GAF domain-containing protein [Saccharopolyspora sp. TS4A08]|uniref:GAF domain-containing protein n=1 Tax=Saccharopolyspora ipomoeae TaxID=3042027 RepID=A0ABT6PGF3_9PSEU|nr:GAF domain-containing protein [Saccharopolyspora sp. TS4A08]MDI2027078.1 GAF domain-containing protein [Saccharopolyspora sp. TS4A08]